MDYSYLYVSWNISVRLLPRKSKPMSDIIAIANGELDLFVVLEPEGLKNNLLEREDTGFLESLLFSTSLTSLIENALEELVETGVVERSDDEDNREPLNKGVKFLTNVAATKLGLEKAEEIKEKAAIVFRETPKEMP